MEDTQRSRRKPSAFVASIKSLASSSLAVSRLDEQALVEAARESPGRRETSVSFVGIGQSAITPATGAVTEASRKLSGIVKSPAGGNSTTMTSSMTVGRHASFSLPLVQGVSPTSAPSPTTAQSTPQAARQTLSRTGSSSGMAAFSKVPLSDDKLREVCLKFLAQNEESRTLLLSHRRSSCLRLVKFQHGVGLKFRASVTAVTFTAILIQQKLQRLAKKLASHTVDPYVVVPGLYEPSLTQGRDVLLFVVSVDYHFPALQTVDVIFLLDHAPIDEGRNVEWRLCMISDDDAEEARPHFEADRSAVVLCQYRQEQKKLLPLRVLENRPTLGPQHYIMKDFQSQVNVQSNDGLTATTEQDEVQKLLAIFSVPLPRYQELQILPPEVQVAINKLSVEVLSRYLYPRLLLKRRQTWRRKLISQAFVPALTLEAFMKQSIFSSWPVSLAEEAIRCLHPVAVERNEIIIHEDENAGSGIFFLVAGHVDVQKKISRKSKSIGPGNTKLLVSLGPVACFGEFAFLTEDPRMASVRATAPSSLWVLEKADFHRLYAKVPLPITAKINEVAFRQRTKNMLNTYPLNVQVLRGYAIFSQCTDEVLQKIIPRIKSHAVPRGTTITKFDEVANVFYFLRRGVCGVFRYVRERREEIHIVTLNPPAVIGDDAVIFGTPYSSTVRAITNCDLYALYKEEFENLMSLMPKQWDAIKKQAATNRQALLHQSQYRFKEMVVNIPFIRDMLTLTQRLDLLRLFTPVVYHPRELVCCCAHFADRVVIVVEGRVRLDSGHLWQQGEAAGYTAVVPHRWTHSAFSLGTSKVIELPLETYVTYLKKYRVYEAVVERVTALMFPKAADPNLLVEAIAATQHLCTPPMYPLSLSSRVNHHEPGFGLKVVRHKPIATDKVPDLVPPDEASKLKEKLNVTYAAEAKKSLERIMIKFAERNRVGAVSLPSDAAHNQPVWTHGKLLVSHHSPSPCLAQIRAARPHSTQPRPSTAMSMSTLK